MKLNFNKESVGRLSSSIKSAGVSKSLLFAFITWLVIFVLETILISGGLYAKSTPFVVFEIIAVIVAMVIYTRKLKLTGKELITSLVTIAVVYAIFDFLIVNLILQTNDFSIYKFWAYYLKYVVILVTPFTRGKTPRIAVPNLKLPLTKKN